MFESCKKRHYGEGVNMAIVIDGIIGAGKTTIGQILEKHYHLKFYKEIKSQDNDSLIQRMLDRFYKDPKRWSAIIQTMFLNDRFRDIKCVQNIQEEALFDRSIYGDEVFARNIHKRGEMTDDEFEIYQSILVNMLEHVKVPKLLIFVDVSVDTAMDRINKRARSTEADIIPRDYMEDLYDCYQSWYEEFDLCPKIKIDFNDHLLDDNHLNEEAVLELLKPILEKSLLES